MFFHDPCRVADRRVLRCRDDVFHREIGEDVREQKFVPAAVEEGAVVDFAVGQVQEAFEPRTETVVGEGGVGSQEIEHELFFKQVAGGVFLGRDGVARNAAAGEGKQTEELAAGPVIDQDLLSLVGPDVNLDRSAPDDGKMVRCRAVPLVPPDVSLADYTYYSRRLR